MSTPSKRAFDVAAVHQIALDELDFAAQMIEVRPPAGAEVIQARGPARPVRPAR